MKKLMILLEILLSVGILILTMQVQATLPVWPKWLSNTNMVRFDFDFQIEDKKINAMWIQTPSQSGVKNGPVFFGNIDEDGIWSSSNITGKYHTEFAGKMRIEIGSLALLLNETELSMINGKEMNSLGELIPLRMKTRFQIQAEKDLPLVENSWPSPPSSPSFLYVSRIKDEKDSSHNSSSGLLGSNAFGEVHSTVVHLLPNDKVEFGKVLKNQSWENLSVNGSWRWGTLNDTPEIFISTETWSGTLNLKKKILIIQHNGEDKTTERYHVQKMTIKAEVNVFLPPRDTTLRCGSLFI